MRHPAFVRTVGVLVMDWSVRGKFNGIGNEIQHYLEMLVLALASGRAAYVQTQRSDCEGALLSGHLPLWKFRTVRLRRPSRTPAAICLG
jgi:hypothetical protein